MQRIRQLLLECICEGQWTAATNSYFGDNWEAFRHWKCIESPILAIFLENIECDTWAKYALCADLWKGKISKNLHILWAHLCCYCLHFRPYHIHTSTYNRRTPDLIWCIALHNERLAICRLSPLFALLSQRYGHRSASVFSEFCLYFYSSVRRVLAWRCQQSDDFSLSKSECEACRMGSGWRSPHPGRITKFVSATAQWSTVKGRDMHWITDRLFVSYLSLLLGDIATMRILRH